MPKMWNMPRFDAVPNCQAGFTWRNNKDTVSIYKSFFWSVLHRTVALWTLRPWWWGCWISPLTCWFSDTECRNASTARSVPVHCISRERFGFQFFIVQRVMVPNKTVQQVNIPVVVSSEKLKLFVSTFSLLRAWTTSTIVRWGRNQSWLWSGHQRTPRNLH